MGIHICAGKQVSVMRILDNCRPSAPVTLTLTDDLPVRTPAVLCGDTPDEQMNFLLLGFKKLSSERLTDTHHQPKL